MIGVTFACIGNKYKIPTIVELWSIYSNHTNPLFHIAFTIKLMCIVNIYTPIVVIDFPYT